MAKGVKTRNIESFREGLMEYAYGRCSQSKAAKMAGMSRPTFRKYANMYFLGIGRITNDCKLCELWRTN